MQEAPELARSFDQLLAALDYPLLIATTAAGGQREGCLVGFASQCSIDPPRFLVCLSDQNRTYRLATSADALAVHAISGPEADLAELFGAATGDEIDKFARCEWSPGPGDVPILDRVPAWFVGSITGTGDLGDHAGFLLSPIAAELRREFVPLTSRFGARLEPGHEA